MPPRKIAQEQAGPIESYRDGPLGRFLEASPLCVVASTGDALPAEFSQAVVLAPWILQDFGDYRGTLQRWFACLAMGGTLVVTVPHAFLHERRDRLPSPWRPRQKRLYTPASLAAEIEEALAPNSYRLRWLGDQDTGYDYALDRAAPPVGEHGIAVALERIAAPEWDLHREPPPAAPPPDYAFEPLRTRQETEAGDTPRRILLLKLDHLGDFIVGVPALRAVRAHFPDAHITLVVGSWNEGLARRLAIADEIVLFDAFPRNAAEAAVDIAATAGEFDALVIDRYDLAIDLRTFSDTRILLRNVDAGAKAGLGNRGVHPFLDIYLPMDPAHDGFDHAWAIDIGLSEFLAPAFCHRSRFQISCPGNLAQQRPSVLLWGPYRNLLPGEYLFQPFLEIEPVTPGLLAYDVALNNEQKVFGVFAETTEITVSFRVEENVRAFEFRLLTVGDEAVPDFRFYGGRLIKSGAPAKLHQSEYQRLLVDLVAMRLAQDSDKGAA